MELETIRQQSRSVKRDDEYGTAVQFIVPAFLNHYAPALPPTLPTNELGFSAFYQQRDVVQLSAPNHEGMWASAIGIAIAKMASMAWEVESPINLRRDKTQKWLLNAGAGMGIFGWVPFLSMDLRSYLGTGLGYIEIERATPANGSKIINVHHLNPLRCRLTGNPQKPVNYLSPDGNTRPLFWHQVIILADMPDPTEGENGIVMSATARAYKQIVKLAAIEQYLYEKVSGQRPLSLYFINGVIQRHVEDAVQSAREDANRKNLVSYMGAAIVPIAGDVPVNVVEVPLAELPDGFEATTERNRSDLIYANAIGLDPQDLNPELVGRQGLGSTGNQSQVLANKEKGRGLSAWRQQFSHNINELALDDKTMFTFRESDLQDLRQEADIKKVHAETRKIQIEDGEITPEQARNLAVDDGDLPREFIEEDMTGGDAIGDDDKPTEEQSEQDKVEQEVPGMEETKELVWEGVY